MCRVFLDDLKDEGDINVDNSLTRLGETIYSSAPLVWPRKN